jgi:purine-binding chemotaxis protein CheW
VSELERGMLERAADLREAFDRAFAAPEAAAGAAQLELLLIRVRGQDYALRLSQVLSLHADRRLVPVPSPRPELLGLLGVRGQVAPVYDLGLLLGYEASPHLRWVVLVRAATPLGLAFEQFDAQLRVPHSALLATADAAAAHRFASASVATTNGARPVIDLAALAADLTDSKRRTLPEREGRR